MQAGNAPKPMMTRHILSTARPQTPPQAATFFAVKRDSLKPAVTTKATMAAANCPMPCMANTEPIIAPRHFVVANLARLAEESLFHDRWMAYSDVMIEESG